MSEEKLLEFKEVVAHFNITPRTLRYYEYLELIFPIKKGRKRFYSKREMARLQLILRGRRFGFKLEEIRQWLEMYKPENDNIEQNQVWIKMAKGQIEELESRRGELEKIIEELTDLIKVSKKHIEKKQT